MRALESAPTFALPDTSLWLLGDVHGNTRWLQRALPAMRRFDSKLTTVLQLGDWWHDVRAADYWARATGLERIFVTLGNHEPYGEVTPLLAEHPGHAVRVSEAVWLLPRPFRFIAGGCTFLSLGGAASADTEYRTEGVDWWVDEEITDPQVNDAISSGPAEVLLTHESPELNPVAASQRVIQNRGAERSDDVAAVTATSRHQVQRVVDATRPRLHAHGHLHVSGQDVAASGTRVVSLGRDDDAGAIARLDLTDFSVRILTHTDVWHRRR
ncbi:metallophosphoesterase [Microbacterium sp. No. 7]|uniref:metallophosphoesterase family protein n=1 Tax=Microbacterium sp. No. 7 TaxID=1714373 RepID=UPI003009D86A